MGQVVTIGLDIAKSVFQVHGVDESGAVVIRLKLARGRLFVVTDDDCTFSVGVISGGQWVNCVPTACRAEALSMAKRQSDLDRGVERMLRLSVENPDGTRFTVARGVTRPVWEPDDGTLRLYHLARDVARELGFDLDHGSAGGGSDANFTGAAGIASPDGLGLLGAGYHTLEEHIEIDSLAQRTRLMAGLLTRLEA